MRESNERERVHSSVRPNNYPITEQPGDPLPAAPPPAPPVEQQQNINNQNESGVFSNQSLGLNMSFANLWTTITAEQERKVRDEFYLDIVLLVITVVLL